MRLPEVLRTATFRNAATASAAFAVASLLLFAFIFWQATRNENAWIDTFLRYEMSVLRHENLGQLRADINKRLAGDLHRLTFAALFDAQGRPIAGDVTALPAPLVFSGEPFKTHVTRAAGADERTDTVRAVAARLPGGMTLFLGRSAIDMPELTRVIERALTLGLLPAVALALIAGTLASQRFLARIRVISRTIERIMAGDLNGRLPARKGGDAVDQLASGANAMLDEIVRLLGEVKAVGDGIAHDLRTPLTRIRSRLEGALKRADTKTELEDAVRRCIEDLDQTFAITTALLRIGEIEGAGAGPASAMSAWSPSFARRPSFTRPWLRRGRSASHAMWAATRMCMATGICSSRLSRISPTMRSNSRLQADLSGCGFSRRRGGRSFAFRIRGRGYRPPNRQPSCSASTGPIGAGTSQAVVSA